MAVAFQAVDRWGADYADQDQGRKKELELLGSDRSADPEPGPLLPEDNGPTQVEGRSRRRGLYHERCGAIDAGQGSVWRTLCALPLEQTSHPGSRSRPSRLRRSRLFGLLEQVLELD